MGVSVSGIHGMQLGWEQTSIFGVTGHVSVCECRCGNGVRYAGSLLVPVSRTHTIGCQESEIKCADTNPALTDR